MHFQVPMLNLNYVQPTTNVVASTEPVMNIKLCKRTRLVRRCKNMTNKQ